MKRFTFVAVCLLTAAAGARAQSSVTLYGLVDEGVGYTSNAAGGRMWAMYSGTEQAPRWGLRGNEDLGGGLRALFVLENGFDTSTGKLGQGGLEFGRQAYVGLGNSFGTVTLGRQYDSVVDYVGVLEAGDQWAGYIGAHPGDLDNFNNLNRVNSAVKFTSAKFGGFTFGGLYSLGGVAGNFTQNQIWSAGASYSVGALSLGAGYLNVRNPNTSFFGNNGNSGIAGNNYMGNSPVYSGYATASTDQVIGAAASYVIAQATVGATYSYTQFRGLNGLRNATLNPRALSGSAAFNNAEVNFKWQFTTAFLAGIAYDYTQGTSIDGMSGARYNQVSVGADYFLSKRTDLYMIGVWQKAGGHDSTGAAARASINLLTPSSSDMQTALRFGIRHKF
ncbi:UNVERIFIED_ORG: putative porin [Paraburkholderia sediminicola]|nr:putative porin [Paraburkholderia sediminicola]